jgi:hypothetical protein
VPPTNADAGLRLRLTVTMMAMPFAANFPLLSRCP